MEGEREGKEGGRGGEAVGSERENDSLIGNTPWKLRQFACNKTNWSTKECSVVSSCSHEKSQAN